jgi:hypothetical protein
MIALPTRRVLRASPRRWQRLPLRRVGLITARLAPIDSGHRSRRTGMIRPIKCIRVVAVEVLPVLVVRQCNAPCMPHLAWKCIGALGGCAMRLIFPVDKGRECAYDSGCQAYHPWSIGVKFSQKPHFVGEAFVFTTYPKYHISRGSQVLFSPFLRFCVGFVSLPCHGRAILAGLVSEVYYRLCKC